MTTDLLAEARKDAETFLARGKPMGVMSLSITAESLARHVLALADALEAAELENARLMQKAETLADVATTWREERDEAREALRKAADTFADLTMGLRAIGHPTMAEACAIAERHSRPLASSGRAGEQESGDCCWIGDPCPIHNPTLQTCERERDEALEAAEARCEELVAALETAFAVIEHMEKHHRWHHEQEGREVESDEFVMEGLATMQEAFDA